MAESTITPLDWGTITDSIRKGGCVPFLGAGVNVSTNGYRGLPLGSEVARRLLGKLVNEDPPGVSELVKVEPGPLLADYQHLLRVGAQDLARVALHIQVKGGNPRLLELLEEILKDRLCKPSPLLRVLAKLPVRLIVTTNYDRLMEQAFDDAKQPDPIVVIQPIDGFSLQQQEELKQRLSEYGAAESRPRAKDEPVVLYKIHGTLGDESGELIISEQDYIDFLTVLGKESQAGVPPLISAMVQDNSLLFLGYGLEDWDFRTIYRAVIETLPKRAQRMSFAIQKDPSPFWEEFWLSKKVRIYNVDLYEFADELNQRMGIE
jgi:SIR2-like domain